MVNYESLLHQISSFVRAVITILLDISPALAPSGCLAHNFKFLTKYMYLRGRSYIFTTRETAMFSKNMIACRVSSIETMDI